LSGRAAHVARQRLVSLTAGRTTACHDSAVLRIFRALTALLIALSPLAAEAEGPPALAARAWLLLDATSGARLAAFEPGLRLPPASLTKLMTAYVTFAALADQRIEAGAVVTVSPAAFAAPGKAGARMFIEPGRPVTVEQLLHGILVVSANDAAIALAEHVAGSVPAFVARMNAEARRLGMINTHFANPTGLSDPQNYSSAEDLARLAQRLLVDFPQHAHLFALREFTYNKVTQANRNRLLWSDAAIDGMKTGQLSEVGWSIVATAARPQGSADERFDRRLIAVVLGAATEAGRGQDALRLLNYGYVAFDTVRLFEGGAVLARPRVWQGDRSEVPIGVERDVYVTVPASELRALGAAGLQTLLERQEPLLAPLRQGETVGRLRVSAGPRVVAEVPVIVLERVGTGGLVGRAYDAVRLWWRRRS
jgi:serine-type D-Ala-D-Ala carboxypeptidase (penicillin-binding protein 5/6)